MVFLLMLAVTRLIAEVAVRLSFIEIEVMVVMNFGQFELKTPFVTNIFIVFIFIFVFCFFGFRSLQAPMDGQI